MKKNERIPVSGMANIGIFVQTTKIDFQSSFDLDKQRKLRVFQTIKKQIAIDACYCI